MEEKGIRLNELKHLYQQHTGVETTLSALEKSEKIQWKGVQASAFPLIASALQEKANKKLIYVLKDAESAGYFYHDLTRLLGEKNVLFFPTSYKRELRFEKQDAANKILRTEALSELQNERSFALVTYPDALFEKVVSTNELLRQRITLKKGETISMEGLINQLLSLSFTRIDYVAQPGQFAVRGSLIDLFSFSSERPFRIDFFGDEIESIRAFDIRTQLSEQPLKTIDIIPSFTEKKEEEVSFLNTLPKETLFLFSDYQWAINQIQLIEEKANSSELEVFEETLHFSETLEFIEQWETFPHIIVNEKPLDKQYLPIEFHTLPQPQYRKNFDHVSTSFQRYLKEGYQLYILSDSHKQIERIEAIFEDKDQTITFTPIEQTLHAGFIDHDLKIGCFTDHQLFDRYHKYTLKSDKVRSSNVALSIKELQQFNYGDYVVHVDHGIGKFVGLVRAKINDKMQEVVKLLFKNDDVLFVSIHSLHRLSKYRSKDGEPPKISKLGTGAWQKMKNKTKKKVKDIAKDLIQLYSQRMKEKGFAYSPDSFMQKELEASFIYEDTPDQLKTTQAVKEDMEKEMPMDRLVCGDVGFGKTEIAIRAAFKAVADDKQVAIMVPTTVLALQHYQTFSKRLKEFPCEIDYISRARTSKEIKEIKEGLKNGRIGIIIGTHRLIGKDIRFKDLGLLVIDEEQKFGVSIKEKLRTLKVNIDTLTMSATPIPRTLQFSMMGARDLSVITTPPPNRHPIQTELHQFNKTTIEEAIRFELNRNGQVLFVNNRVQTIEEMAALIRQLVPEARVAVGHGQMKPADLEKLLMNFINCEYDVLVATTIVESGIDIPNVNTILINNAQNFGLSDLHQLRGRVGRSNKKAFCYLLAPPLSALSSDSRRRLQAIENFSDLGSGFYIAMQDLDIRGAGNILGGEQSGFIANVGYETYQKILTEALSEIQLEEMQNKQQTTTDEKGQQPELDFTMDCQVESDLEILFPEQYVTGSSERILLYRELDGLKKEEEVDQFVLRLIDRFGQMPQQAEELINLVKLRLMIEKMGIDKVVLKNRVMYLYFASILPPIYYQSKSFSKFLLFVQNNTQAGFKERNNKRFVFIPSITTVQAAFDVIKEIAQAQ